MSKYEKKTYATLEALVEQLEADGYDVLNESYNTLDIIDIYESDDKVQELTFYRGDYGVRVQSVKTI